MTQSISNFTPREIVSELDRYIVGQHDAKRSVAIAMRNRWRRQQVEAELRDEISPKNIILMGPTGVGKTEIARRLSKLANAPFVKVEASKFTEVGYVGKDVESMIRELMDIAVNMVKSQEEEKVQTKAEELAEERLLDLLIPPKPKSVKKAAPVPVQDALENGESNAVAGEVEAVAMASAAETRQKFRKMLREGKLDQRLVELDSQPPRPPMGMPMIEVVSTGGSLDDISKNFRDMFSNMFPRGSKRKKLKIPEALKILQEEEAQKLIEMDEVIKKAIVLLEQTGIVFIDEIDKIASRERGGQGPDVSREGVQRDILPIVEGSRVNTRYGMVQTDHILFIASGAFHVSKPSDLIPELQGRFPIRVELNSLNEADFLRILTEPKNALVTQYMALMKTEKVDLKFTKGALKELARYAALANEQMENIGARRLHTVMEKVLDDLSFSATEKNGEKIEINEAYVKKCLDPIVKDKDLSKYIL